MRRFAHDQRCIHLLCPFILLLPWASTVLAVDHTKDTVETIKKNLDDGKATMIDVREKSEWNAGHLKIAGLVPLSDLQKKSGDAEFLARLKKLAPKNKIVYCHCRSGGRAKVAGDVLKKLGYDVRPLKYGFSSLVNLGFEKADQ